MFAREIIGLINNNVKGNKVEIGRIDLMKNFSFVEVVEADADRVVKAMKHGVTVKGRSVVMEVSDSGPARPSSSQGGEASRRERRKGGGDAKKPWSAKDARTSRNARDAKEPREKKDVAKKNKPSREERGYTAPRGKKYSKEDWMKFLHPDDKKVKSSKKGLRGEEPDFSEEGWARRFPKKK